MMATLGQWPTLAGRTLSLNVCCPLEELYSIRMCVCEVAKMS